MVAALRSLLPLGKTFHGYHVETRLIDTCRAPLHAFAARTEDARAVRLYCMEAIEPSPALRARFLSRLDLLRRIEHERIPRITDGGLDDGLFWLAAEAIEGVSLSDAITSGALLDPMHVVMMLRDAVAPLRVARDAGVLHGRLTPRRLLTSAAECRGVLEVGFDLLFGPFDEGHDVVFRAPEQLDSKSEADERADIYALGALGYFALGSPPFEDTAGAYDPERIKRRIIAEDLPPLSRVRPDCPTAVENLLRLMCAKLKGDRPRSYEDLDEMLARVLAVCVAHRKGKEVTRFIPPGVVDHAPVAAPSSPAIASHHEALKAAPDNEARSPEEGATTPDDVPRAPGGALRAAHRPADARGRAELWIVAVAVSALGCVAVLVSLGAVLLAWRTEPLPAPAVSPAPAAPLALTVPPALVAPPAPLLAPPSTAVESATPLPVTRSSAPLVGPRSEPRASNLVRATVPQPCAKPISPKVSAIEARARCMRYHPEDR